MRRRGRWSRESGQRSRHSRWLLSSGGRPGGLRRVWRQSQHTRSQHRWPTAASHGVFYTAPTTHTCRTSSSSFFFCGLGLQHSLAHAASGEAVSATHTPAASVPNQACGSAPPTGPQLCCTMPAAPTSSTARPAGASTRARTLHSRGQRGSGHSTHGLRSLGLSMRFTSANLRVFLAFPILLCCCSPGAVLLLLRLLLPNLLVQAGFLGGAATPAGSATIAFSIGGRHHCRRHRRTRSHPAATVPPPRGSSVRSS